MDFVQLFITICYLISLISLALSEVCSKVDQCSCKTSTYTIDLHPLSNGASNPRFSVAGGDYTYDYQPCGQLAACGTFKSAAVCQHKGTASYFDAGDSSTATFEGEVETNTLKLSYMSNERKSFIQLQCACEEGLFSFVNEAPTSTYNFILKTKYACATDPCPPTPSVGGLSAGSILLILFFVFLAVYFVGGILFLKFVRGAQGTEMVPNYEFWKALPGLIKDGIMFTCKGCKKDSTYSQI